MIVPIFPALAPNETGYIAGTADGIVTVNGTPKSRQIIVMDAITLIRQTTTKSLDNGHYLITRLNPKKRYLVMCRPIYGLDDQGVTPAVWDNITPANDLSVDEQQKLWQSWQNDDG